MHCTFHYKLNYSPNTVRLVDIGGYKKKKGMLINKNKNIHYLGYYIYY
jgi:phosphoenolpyruvate-protein kinase (PTS system EI component)